MKIQTNELKRIIRAIGKPKKMNKNDMSISNYIRINSTNNVFRVSFVNTEKNIDESISALSDNGFDVTIVMNTYDACRPFIDFVNLLDDNDEVDISINHNEYLVKWKQPYERNENKTLLVIKYFGGVSKFIAETFNPKKDIEGRIGIIEYQLANLEKTFNEKFGKALKKAKLLDDWMNKTKPVDFFDHIRNPLLAEYEQAKKELDIVLAHLQSESESYK
jgi:hypothetical protein